MFLVSQVRNGAPLPRAIPHTENSTQATNAATPAFSSYFISYPSPVCLRAGVLCPIAHGATDTKTVSRRFDTPKTRNGLQRQVFSRSENDP